MTMVESQNLNFGKGSPQQLIDGWFIHTLLKDVSSSLKSKLCKDFYKIAQPTFEGQDCPSSKDRMGVHSIKGLQGGMEEIGEEGLFPPFNVTLYTIV